MDDSVVFFYGMECIGNTQIIHMEETRITQQTIGLVLLQMIPEKESSKKCRHVIKFVL